MSEKNKINESEKSRFTFNIKKKIKPYNTSYAIINILNAFKW